MGTLAGDNPAWGEEWGYDRPGRHYCGDIADIAPRSREGSEDRDVSTDAPGDLPRLLVCTVFWILLIAGAVLWWAGK